MKRPIGVFFCFLWWFCLKGIELLEKPVTQLTRLTLEPET